MTLVLFSLNAIVHGHRTLRLETLSNEFYFYLLIDTKVVVFLVENSTTEFTFVNIDFQNSLIFHSHFVQAGD